MTNPKLASNLSRLLSSDIFSRVRSDQELARLVADTARRSATPYAELLSLLLGAHPELGEAQSREVWQLAVEHRRAMASALGRPVHLRVAAMDWVMRSPREDVAPVVVSRPALSSLLRDATHDGLTGLANRGLFLTLLRHELLQRGERAPVVAYFDLDRFKQVNDVFGHRAGDAVLVEFATLLGRSGRRGDVVARLGGDEFAALYVDAGLPLARAALARLEKQAGSLFARYGMGASIGVVAARKGETAEELLERADQAMYSRKRAGPAHARDGRVTDRPVALYATRSPERLLAIQPVFARRGCVLVPATSLGAATTLCSLLAPRLALADVLFPPKGGQAVLEPCAGGGAVPVALVAPRRMWSLSQGHSLTLPVLAFPLEGDQLERLVTQAVPKPSEALPELVDEAEAKALGAAVASLVAGGSPGEQVLRLVGARPELDLVRRHLGA